MIPTQGSLADYRVLGQPSTCGCSKHSTSRSPWRVLPAALFAAALPKCPACLFAWLGAAGFAGVAEQLASRVDRNVLWCISIAGLLVTVAWLTAQRRVAGVAASAAFAALVLGGRLGDRMLAHERRLVRSFLITSCRPPSSGAFRHERARRAGKDNMSDFVLILHQEGSNVARPEDHAALRRKFFAWTDATPRLRLRVRRGVWLPLSRRR